MFFTWGATQRCPCVADVDRESSRQMCYGGCPNSRLLQKASAAICAKKDERLCPILDLRWLNHVLAKCQFRMITQKQIIRLISRLLYFSGLERFTFSIPKRRSQSFGVHIQRNFILIYWPFGLSLALCTFIQYVDVVPS